MAFHKSGATQAVALIIPKAFNRVCMLVCFTSSSLMAFYVKYLALFCIYPVIGSLEWFWMGSLWKDVWLLLVFLKTSFLVAHFPYYTLTRDNTEKKWAHWGFFVKQTTQRHEKWQLGSGDTIRVRETKPPPPKKKLFFLFKTC